MRATLTSLTVRLLTIGAVVLVGSALPAAPASSDVRAVTVGPTVGEPVALDSGDIVGVERQFPGAPLRVYAKPSGRAEIDVRELAPMATSADVIALSGGRAVIASIEDGAVRLRTRRPDGGVVEDTVRDTDGSVVAPGDLQGSSVYELETSPDGGRVLLGVSDDRASDDRKHLLLVRGAGEEWHLVPYPPTYEPFSPQAWVITDSGRVVFVGARKVGEVMFDWIEARVLAHVLEPGGTWSTAQELARLQRFSLWTGSRDSIFDDLALVALPDGAAAAAWSGTQEDGRHRITAAELPATSGSFAPAADVAAALDRTWISLESDSAADVLLGVSTHDSEGHTSDIYTGRPAVGLVREMPGGGILSVGPAGDAVVSLPYEGGRERFVRSRRGPGGSVELLPVGSFPLDQVLPDGTFISRFSRTYETTSTFQVDVVTKRRGIDTVPLTTTLGCRISAVGEVFGGAAGNWLGFLLHRDDANPAAVFTTPGGSWRVIDMPDDIRHPGGIVRAETGDMVIWGGQWGGDAPTTRLLLATGAATDGRALGPGVGCETGDPDPDSSFDSGAVVLPDAPPARLPEAQSTAGPLALSRQPQLGEPRRSTVRVGRSGRMRVAVTCRLRRTCVVRALLVAQAGERKSVVTRSVLRVPRGATRRLTLRLGPRMRRRLQTGAVEATLVMHGAATTTSRRPVVLRGS